LEQEKVTETIIGCVDHFFTVNWGLEKDKLKLSITSKLALPFPRAGLDREARLNKVHLCFAIRSKNHLFATL